MKNPSATIRKRGAAVGSTALLGLLADIRAAVGDPTGKLMQDELVEHCRRVTNAAKKAQSLADFWEKHGGGNGVAARAKEDAMILACRMIDWPNAERIHGGMRDTKQE